MVFQRISVPATLTIPELLEGHQAGLPDDVLGRLFRMRHVAVCHHKTDRRKTGEPYHEHCLSVEDMVRQVMQLYPDLVRSPFGEEEQEAACGHDLFEALMTSIDGFEKTILELSDYFTRRVVWLIGALTKWDRETYWEQLYWANCRDLWVVIIKILDRLHNLRTIKGFKLEKQLEYLEETLGPLLGLCARSAEYVGIRYSYAYPVYQDLICQLQETAEEELQRVTDELSFRLCVSKP